jgi:hypothetical protein
MAIPRLGDPVDGAQAARYALSVCHSVVLVDEGDFEVFGCPLRDSCDAAKQLENRHPSRGMRIGALAGGPKLTL